LSPSISPSISPSRSPSSSISSSPSSSISASYSPSSSQSISPSSSISISPSLSPSISPSSSPSVSPSISPSESPSSSPSIPLEKDYTRGDYLELPVDDTNLETAYSMQDIIDVETEDDILVGQQAADQIAIHMYKDYSTANSAHFEWIGQSTFAPSNIAIYLQIYNFNSAEWETLSSNNIANADTNFTLSGDKEDLTDYKDGSGFVVCRIYQDLR